VSGQVLLKHDVLHNTIDNRLYYQAHHVLVILNHSPFYRVTVPNAACVQLCPPEDEHLILETYRGE